MERDARGGFRRAGIVGSQSMEKSEDGDFPSYRGSVFILLTPESCDSYRLF